MSDHNDWYRGLVDVLGETFEVRTFIEDDSQIPRSCAQTMW